MSDELTRGDIRRAEYLDVTLRPAAEKAFANFPWLQSVTLLFAQYYDDGALDAMHLYIAVSCLETPDLEEFFLEVSAPRDVVIPLRHNIPDGEKHPFSNWDDRDNIYMIWESTWCTSELFAAYCPDGDQCSPPEENYRPYVVFRRAASGEITSEVVGVQLRPWADQAHLIEVA